MSELADLACIDAPDDVEEFNRWAIEQHWGDGLPMVPPTTERVCRMLSAYDRPHDDVVGKVPPLWRDATVAKLATNAVLAGARSEHFPIIVHAVQALLHPSVNLYGLLATTHPCSTMVMVNGPLAREVGLQAGSGLFGPGFQANAAIGRAVRLALQNIGGAYPGEGDKSTMGSAAKFSFCFAENEEASPWEPYHVELGYAQADSTVTVVGAEPPHNIEDHESVDARGLLGMLAYSVAYLGCNNAYSRTSDFFVGLCPEHAATLARHGFSKADVREFLFQQARIPYQRWRGRGAERINADNLPRYFDALSDDMSVPMTDRPENIRIIVVGGPGLHSCWIPTFGLCRSHTTPIRTTAGSPARSLGDLRRSRPPPS
jgi:hypothetical protein